MFTGIIEKMERVLAVADAAGQSRLTLTVPWTDLRPGESIAVNGCCLTISRLTAGEMDFDVVPQTLSRTNLGSLRPGDEVHVERSLRMCDRLDGHIVQGHIDAAVELLAREDGGQESRLTLQTPPELGRFIVPQGSVALDGVSLTVAAANPSSFQVALIPTTLARTTLGRRPIGWRFNLEADIVSKTIIFWLERQANMGQSEAVRR